MNRWHYSQKRGVEQYKYRIAAKISQNQSIRVMEKEDNKRSCITPKNNEHLTRGYTNNRQGWGYKRSLGII